MKLRCLLPFVLLAVGPVASLCGQTVPPDSQMTVKLLAPLSTKTNQAGDKISAQVIDPPGFKGDIVEGQVRKVKNGGKIHGTSVLNFTFETLYHQGKVITMESNVLSLRNSQGKENVDEEGEVINKKNNLGKVGLGAAGGAIVGGILGRIQGAAIGAAAGAALAVVLVETTAKGPSIEFAAGSEFVLSVKERKESVEPGHAPPPQPVAGGPAAQPAVTSSSDCAGSGTASVSNGTHGTIRLVSGTGTFATIASENKAVAVVPGELMSGTVQLGVENHGPGFALAPLIWTASWGNPADMWQSVTGSVGVGQSSFAATIKIAAPQSPGTYHIIFAFQLETNGASVASATSWARGQAVWGDANDIAQFSQQQIGEAQQFGCTIGSWLTESGPHLDYIPADAITIEVGGTNTQSPAGFTSALKIPANQPWTPTGIELQPGEPVAIAATGVIITNAQGMRSPPSGAGRDCNAAVGPTGFPFVAPGLSCWSLLGRVGESGTPFEVGNGVGFQSPAAGQLYLGVNDNVFGDNSGFWLVFVSVAHLPASSNRVSEGAPPLAFAGAPISRK